MSDRVLLPIAYLPPISWFAVLLCRKSPLIEAHETYPKQTYRNRCHIAGPNGLQPLIIPVTKISGQISKTDEVLITPGSNWKKLHWRTIETAYNSSPFFTYYRNRIEEIIFSDQTRLFEFNLSLINLLLELLGMKIQSGITDEFIKNPENLLDFRELIHPKKTIFPPALFPAYIQVFDTRHGFFPDLSIIDLLFNEGPASLEYLHEVSLSISTLNLGSEGNKMKRANLD
jgi:hypothetical protein